MLTPHQSSCFANLLSVEQCASWTRPLFTGEGGFWWCQERWGWVCMRAVCMTGQRAVMLTWPFLSQVRKGENTLFLPFPRQGRETIFAARTVCQILYNYEMASHIYFQWTFAWDARIKRCHVPVTAITALRTLTSPRPLLYSRMGACSQTLPPSE